MENILIAEQKAIKGKQKQNGVKLFLENREENLKKIQTSLINQTYKTSPYYKFIIQDPKEREVSRLPFYPDRIVHHAIMNVLEPIFVSNLTFDTYNCIKERGIHLLNKKLKKVLSNDFEGTKYCLKFDIKKFYPSVDNSILKSLLRTKFKDKFLLKLLDEIIDSSKGLPIGNYLSQYLANFYLSKFDHWIKEKLLIKHYFRYADDVVVLSSNKQELHLFFEQIQNYLKNNLNLTIKNNQQIFQLESKGIDFVGYVFYQEKTLIRKRIKKRFIKSVKKQKEKSIVSYRGWLKHCNSNNLIKKYP